MSERRNLLYIVPNYGQDPRSACVVDGAGEGHFSRCAYLDGWHLVEWLGNKFPKIDSRVHFPDTLME